MVMREADMYPAEDFRPNYKKGWLCMTCVVIFMRMYPTSVGAKRLRRQAVTVTDA